jgi:hypothetical protein
MAWDRLPQPTCRLRLVGSLRCGGQILPQQSRVSAAHQRRLSARSSRRRRPVDNDPRGLSLLIQDATGQGRPLDPEDSGAFPAGDYSPAGVCRFPTASPYSPTETSTSAGVTFTRHQRGFTHVRPSHGSPKPGTRCRDGAPTPPAVVSLPVAPGWNEKPLGFFPELRTPQSPATHVEAETGHHALARVLHLRPQSNLQQRLLLALMRPQVAHSPTSIPSPAR